MAFRRDYECGNCGATLTRNVCKEYSLRGDLIDDRAAGTLQVARDRRIKCVECGYTMQPTPRTARKLAKFCGGKAWRVIGICGRYKS